MGRRRKLSMEPDKRSKFRKKELITLQATGGGLQGGRFFNGGAKKVLASNVRDMGKEKKEKPTKKVREKFLPPPDGKSKRGQKQTYGKKLNGTGGALVGGTGKAVKK